MLHLILSLLMGIWAALIVYIGYMQAKQIDEMEIELFQSGGKIYKLSQEIVILKWDLEDMTKSRNNERKYKSKAKLARDEYKKELLELKANECQETKTKSKD